MEQILFLFTVHTLWRKDLCNKLIYFFNQDSQAEKKKTGNHFRKENCRLLKGYFISVFEKVKRLFRRLQDEVIIKSFDNHPEAYPFTQ